MVDILLLYADHIYNIVFYNMLLKRNILFLLLGMSKYIHTWWLQFLYLSKNLQVFSIEKRISQWILWVLLRRETALNNAHPSCLFDMGRSRFNDLFCLSCKLILWLIIQYHLYSILIRKVTTTWLANHPFHGTYKLSIWPH